MQAAARAPADGHTIVLTGVGSNAINHGLYAKMPYNSRKDLAHITMIASGPNVLVVNAEFPAKTLKELVELVKANPGKYNYASNGNGSSGHVAMELFKQTADPKIDIPYKGGGPAMTDVIGGQVPIYFTNQDAAMPHIKSGKLRALAVTSLERNPLYPDVPTIAELGYPGFQAISWTGLSAPAKTPKDIVARLHAETIKALQVPAVKERLSRMALSLAATAARTMRPSSAPRSTSGQRSRRPPVRLWTDIVPFVAPGQRQVASAALVSRDFHSGEPLMKVPLNL